MYLPSMKHHKYCVKGRNPEHREDLPDPPTHPGSARSSQPTVLSRYLCPRPFSVINITPFDQLATAFVSDIFNNFP